MAKLNRIAAGLCVLCLAAAAADRPVTIRAYDGSAELRLATGWLRTESARGDRAVRLTVRHPRQDAYLAVVVERPLAGLSLDDYADAAAEHLLARLTTPTRTAFAAVTVDGHAARRCEVTGTVGKVSVGYVVTVVETPAGFAQAVGWTAADKLDANRGLLTDATDGLR